MRVVFTKRASSRLREIFAYLESHSPIGKANVQTRIDETIQLIATYPYSGRKVSISGVYVRVVNPYPYLIFYRVKARSLLILTLRHAAQRPLA